MDKSNRWQIQLKSLFQLGLEQTGLYGLYQFGLKSGQIARQTPIHPIQPSASPEIHFPWRPVSQNDRTAVMSDSREALRREADEILAGSFRCFGGPLRPIQLRPAVTPPTHWTRPSPESTEQDIKFFWEPARFGWAMILGRAYAWLGDERYAQVFWERLEEFIAFNPANAGPNWASAQEVAVRLMAVSFAAWLFQSSPQSTPERMRLLRGFIGAHAMRIPPTLSYSQAQNNNHLLTEAAGLWTAAVLLPDHPAARSWRALGQTNFNRGILKQVSLDGSYAQYSTNYHRVLLHCASWIAALYTGQKSVRDIFPTPALTRLTAAIRWLQAQTDPASGQAPNYGHNDGANLLPLSTCPYEDLRPTLQSASRLFFGGDCFPAGPWNEAGLWLGGAGEPVGSVQASPPENPAVLRLDRRDSWAILRASRFHSRPAHADQLHIDLWFKGEPLALDAGTYLYNAPAPWENALVSVSVHNTVQIDGLEPMTRGGRFLWLDWDQAEGIRREDAAPEISARRNGYRRIGAAHERRLLTLSDREWQVIDRITPVGRIRKTHQVVLHWLLADLPWSLAGNALRLEHPAGSIQLAIDCQTPGFLTLDRAGERLYGAGSAAPISGWVSPTYGVRKPALSLCVAWQSELPLEFISRWQFPPQPR